MQGNYEGIAPFLVSPVAGLQNAGFEVSFANGTTVSGTDTTGFAEALAAAGAADAIVFVGGIDNSVEAEGHDRDAITWPGNQLDLVSELEQLGKPLVVLQMGGGQVDSSSLKSSNAVRLLLSEFLAASCADPSSSGQRVTLGRIPESERGYGDSKHPHRQDRSRRPPA